MNVEDWGHIDLNETPPKYVLKVGDNGDYVFLPKLPDDGAMIRLRKENGDVIEGEWEHSTPWHRRVMRLMLLIEKASMAADPLSHSTQAHKTVREQIGYIDAVIEHCDGKGELD